MELDYESVARIANLGWRGKGLAQNITLLQSLSTFKLDLQIKIIFIVDESVEVLLNWTISCLVRKWSKMSGFLKAEMTTSFVQL